MPELDDLLRSLQLGDSFFPSGAVSFSWSLEMLRHDGVVASERDLRAFVEGQLRGRWAGIERPVLTASYRAFPDVEAVARIDRLVESLTLPTATRQGSRRAGAALLGVHQRLATPQADAYYGLVRRGDAPGHQAVVQGLVWCAAELSEASASAVSAHGLTVSLLGAALRLGLIGHIASQRCLADMREVIAGILALAPPALSEIGAFAPQTEIAAMRHETATARLFAT